MSIVTLCSLLLPQVLSVAAAATKFTAQDLLSAPRRGTADPNPAGTLALFTVSTYSFEEHATSVELRVLNVTDGTSWLFSNLSDATGAHWLQDGNNIIWPVTGDNGITSFAIGDATKPDAEPIVAGTIPGVISDFKLAPLSNGTIAVAFYGQASPNGTLYNPAFAVEPLSTGRAYTALFVRHWDTYITTTRNSIFYAAFAQTGTNNKTAYSLSAPINALNGTGLESPIPPFGSTDNFDISPAGITFVAKDPSLNQATTTKSDLYFVPLKTFREPVAPKPVQISTPGLQGASTAPKFSTNNTKIAFARQRAIAYESDKWRVLVVDIRNSTTAVEVLSTEDAEGGWDRSASTILWSSDDKELYVSAEDFARVRLFRLSAKPGESARPNLIYKDGVVTDFHLLKRSPGHDTLLVSSSSIVDNSIFSTVDASVSAPSNATDGITLVSSNLDNGARFGLSKSQVSEVWFKGDGDYNVHSWVIKPSFWNSNETYPLAFVIHGGPQGAWEDSWSTRWNLAVYAEQGYVVFAPNPTGSTGFGQNFTDSIQNQWGGRPYQDLVKGYEYVEKNLSYVDTNRSVALGASYGGYMIYWIQGQRLGRKFEALFAHDGNFNTLAQWATEELWFTEHDFNGTLWDSWDNYARWNPANHTDQWATPQLIVHNELDYRLPISEGLAAFNVLQTRGVKSKFLSFPDENHWVLKPENSLVWHKTVLDWINEYAGLPAYSSPNDTGYHATLQNGLWI